MQCDAGLSDWLNLKRREHADDEPEQPASHQLDRDGSYSAFRFFHNCFHFQCCQPASDGSGAAELKGGGNMALAREGGGMKGKRFRIGQRVQSACDPSQTFIVRKSRVPERIYFGANRW